MKVILTGATGFIGGEILQQALAHPSITSLVCITRKALPDSVSSNPKLQVIILSDFTSYPPEVLAKLKGAQACIWAIGSPARKSTDLEKCRSIEIGYSTTAAKAFGESLAPQLEGFRSFRFVYLSGMFAEREKDKKLWFLADSRNIKGEAEVGILEIQKQCSNFRVSIVRPGGVLGKGSLVPNFLMGRLLHIKLEELAAAMIDEAIIDEPVGNVEATRTLENDSLRARGRRALAKAN